jgi:uncharacterized C2H2 Zn-finger protein
MNLDKGDLEEDPGDSGYKCPLCLMILSSKASYARHVNFTCKKKKQGSDILTTKRVSPVPATQVQVDKELDGLLANVPSPYTRWRLAQVLGVTQQETYPVLWHYSFPGSRTSMVSSYCPTSDPSDVMFNILSDARTNYDIEKIVMQNSVEVIGPDGTKVNVSKWLKPLGEGEVRSNRPQINVEEIEDKLVYSLIVKKTFEKSDLEE